MADNPPVGRFKFEWKSVNCDGRHGLALLAICGVLLLVALGGDTAFIALRYDRTSIGAGQWWRLLSGHLVHLSVPHALLNGVGLSLMWALFAREYSARRWILTALAAIAAIDAGLWFRDTDVSWYVGASGVLHGVMAAGTVSRLRDRDPYAWLLAAFLIGKLTYEQLVGPMPSSTAVGPVMVNAHLYGAIGGLIAALLPRKRVSL